MQVFVSWSGKQAEEIAKALREHLPPMLAHKVTFFVSAEDIAKGSRGLNVIATQLEAANFGLVVVTPQNVNAPWINFEAGALGKSLQEGKVAPVLIGMTDADVAGPIKQFQNTVAIDENEMYRLVESINTELEDPFNARALRTLFDGNWAALKDAVDIATSAYADTSASVAVERDDAEVLSEVLTTVRALQRDLDRLNLLQDKQRDYWTVTASNASSSTSVNEGHMRGRKAHVPMYHEGIAPVIALHSDTLIFDVRRQTQVAWLSGRLVMPVGAQIELYDPNTNTHGTATVVNVRLLSGTPKTPNQVCLDCEVDDRWWRPVDERNAAGE